MSAEFIAWPKTPRFFRDIIVTEKIDGTNAAIHIEDLGDWTAVATDANGILSGNVVRCGANMYRLTAQSRKRLISPGKATDNYGFAAWVQTNATNLVERLGVGTHFGEWWGNGINRGYGLSGRRFSLFNTDRYAHVHYQNEGGRVDSVPLLYQGPFKESAIRAALGDLKANGSHAAPGFMNPEGIIIWHSQTRTNFKVTLDNQDAGKWEAAPQ